MGAWYQGGTNTINLCRGELFSLIGITYTRYTHKQNHFFFISKLVALKNKKNLHLWSDIVNNRIVVQVVLYVKYIDTMLSIKL